MNREIVSSERMNVFEPDAVISFLFRLDGNPDAEELAIAVREAFTLNESTMSKVILDSDGRAGYERLQESANTVTITTQDYLSIFEREKKIPFAIFRGEMMRVYILQKENETQLFTMSHHLAGDGTSVICFAEDVMKLINGEKCVYKEMHLLTGQNDLARGYVPYLIRQKVKFADKKWASNKHIFAEQDYQLIHNNYWEKMPSEVRIKTFRHAQSQQLCEKAKELGVSVTCLIGAVFTAAFSNEKKEYCIGLAVNAREDGDDSMSNLVTGIKFMIPTCETETLKEKALLFQQLMKEKLSNEKVRNLVLRFIPLLNPSLADSILFYIYGLFTNPITARLAESLGYTKDKRNDLGITNLTNITFPKANRNYTISDCIFIPPAVSYAHCILGIVTTQKGMHLTFRFRQDEDAQEKEMFWERGIAAMEAVIHVNA